MTLALLLACAPLSDEFEAAGFGISAVESGLKKTTAKVKVTLRGSTSGTDTEFLLRQIVPGTEAVTEYETLVSVDATSGSGSLVLPSSPPTADLALASSGMPVIYALALVDGDGVIYGIGKQYLCWYATSPDGKASAGWLLVSKASDGSYAYKGTNSGMTIRAGIEGTKTLSMSGQNELGEISDMRFGVTTMDQTAEVGSVEVTDSYSFTASASPDAAYLGEEGGVSAAYYSTGTYVDEDADAAFDPDTEAMIGVGCSEALTGVVRWIEPPTDLAAAFALDNLGAQWGWEVGYLDGFAFTEFSGSQRTHLDVKEACG